MAACELDARQRRLPPRARSDLQGGGARRQREARAPGRSPAGSERRRSQAGTEAPCEGRPRRSAMSRVIGIDLGTTNSCVAIVEDGKPVVIPNRAATRRRRRWSRITEDGKRLVGHIAKRQAITNARNTVYAAKRLIGRKFGTRRRCRRAIEICPYDDRRGPARRRAHPARATRCSPCPRSRR